MDPTDCANICELVYLGGKPRKSYSKQKSNDNLLFLEVVLIVNKFVGAVLTTNPLKQLLNELQLLKQGYFHFLMYIKYPGIFS